MAYFAAVVNFFKAHGQSVACRQAGLGSPPLWDGVGVSRGPGERCVPIPDRSAWLPVTGKHQARWRLSLETESNRGPTSGKLPAPGEQSPWRPAFCSRMKPTNLPGDT